MKNEKFINAAGKIGLDLVIKAHSVYSKKAVNKRAIIYALVAIAIVLAIRLCLMQ